MPGMEIASLYARIGADLTGLNSGLKTAGRGLDGFAGKVTGLAGGIVKTLGRAAAVGGAAIAGLGVAAAKQAGDFEASVNLMGVAATGAAIPLEDLRSAALAVGEDANLVGIDAMEASDAITVLLKSGMDAADVFGNLQGYLAGTAELGGALRASVDLAAASDLEFAESADAVSVALATFGRPATDAVRIADNFVGAADASVAEVSDLTAAFVNFGPTANQFGWKLEDVNTALALLSQRGIRGGEAGTALKSMMTNMMRQTGDTVGTLEKLNITLYDQEGQMRTMPDILGQLERALAGVSEEQRNAAIQTIFGTYGMKAASSLLEEGTEGWEEMEGAIGEAASAQQIAGKRTEGFYGALEILKGTIQTFMIEAGTPLIENFLTPGVRMLTDLISAARESGVIERLGEKFEQLGKNLFGTPEEIITSPEVGILIQPAQEGLLERWAEKIKTAFGLMREGDWRTVVEPIIDGVPAFETMMALFDRIESVPEDLAATALKFGALALAIGPVVTIASQLVTALAAIGPLGVIIGAIGAGVGIGELVSGESGMQLRWNVRQTQKDLEELGLEGAADAAERLGDSLDTAWEIQHRIDTSPLTTSREDVERLYPTPEQYASGERGAWWKTAWESLWGSQAMQMGSVPGIGSNMPQMSVKIDEDDLALQARKAADIYAQEFRGRLIELQNESGTATGAAGGYGGILIEARAQGAR